jgi:hypothetical protein
MRCSLRCHLSSYRMWQGLDGFVDGNLHGHEVAIAREILVR